MVDQQKWYTVIFKSTQKRIQRPKKYFPKRAYSRGT